MLHLTLKFTGLCGTLAGGQEVVLAVVQSHSDDYNAGECPVRTGTNTAVSQLAPHGAVRHAGGLAQSRARGGGAAGQRRSQCRRVYSKSED